MLCSSSSALLLAICQPTALWHLLLLRCSRLQQPAAASLPWLTHCNQLAATNTAFQLLGRLPKQLRCRLHPVPQNSKSASWPKPAAGVDLRARLLHDHSVASIHHTGKSTSQVCHGDDLRGEVVSRVPDGDSKKAAATAASKK